MLACFCLACAASVIFFCSRLDVLDELARKRLLRRLAFVWVTCIITHTSRRKPFKCKPPEVHLTIRNRVPHNKQLTNRACSSRTRVYWPSVVAVRTSTALALGKRKSLKYSLSYTSYYSCWVWWSWQTKKWRANCQERLRLWRISQVCMWQELHSSGDWCYILSS